MHVIAIETYHLGGIVCFQAVAYLIVMALGIAAWVWIEERKGKK